MSKAASTSDVSYLPPTEVYDIILSPSYSTPLDPQFEQHFSRMQHFSFILNHDQHTDQLYHHATDFLKLSAIYWGLMALHLSGGFHLANREKTLEFTMACYDPEIGGFSGNINHSVHLLYTLSGLQILALLGELHRVDRPKVIAYITSLQRPDGSFVGDAWGEVDTRFTYCAFNSLALLGALGSYNALAGGDNAKEASESQTTSGSTYAEININKAVEYLLGCQNFDGGFGASTSAESHSGQIFCSLGALCMVNAFNAGNSQATENNRTLVQANVLGWWLCERQLKNGGLNGRPEKKEDVCYSWWVLTGLCILSRLSWINNDKLSEFIISCQDKVYGGISDRTDTMTDIYHTYFGMAGLSLMAQPGFNHVDPVYALPVETVEQLGLFNWKS